MKKNTHPNYREVIFLDISNNSSFRIRSAAPTKETIVWEDGKEYPLYKLETSSTSHPFFTGTHKIVDVEGRVDKFSKKFGNKMGQSIEITSDRDKRQHQRGD